MVMEKFFSNSIKTFEGAQRNTRYRIFLNVIQDTNAEGSADILKDFNIERRRLAPCVHFRLTVCDGSFWLNLTCVHVQFL